MSLQNFSIIIIIIIVIISIIIIFPLFSLSFLLIQRLDLPISTTLASIVLSKNQLGLIIPLLSVKFTQCQNLSHNIWYSCLYQPVALYHKIPLDLILIVLHNTLWFMFIPLFICLYPRLLTKLPVEIACNVIMPPFTRCASFPHLLIRWQKLSPFLPHILRKAELSNLSMWNLT